MRKLTILFAALTLCAGLWAQEVTVNNIRYTIDPSAGSASVYRGDDASGALTIPSTVRYNGKDYPVTSIGAKK